MKGMDKKARTALETSLILMGNEAKNFFVESFRKQGFEDKVVTKWKPRKDKSKSSQGRAILVKTGDLRRSIKREMPNKAGLSIRISSDLPYSKIHNEGLMGNAFGKHAFKMPKREFMGSSYVMNEKIKKVIIKKLDSVFK